jgi:two-component system NtrC family sensor kinase
MTITSMKTKMTLAVFLMVVFLMSVTAITAMFYFEKKFKQSISRDQFALLGSFATQIDERIFDSLADLDTLADSITPALLANHDQAQRFLDSQKEHLVFFDNSLFLFSKTGSLVAASPGEMNLIGKDNTFHEYFKKTVATGKIIVSPPFAFIQKKSYPIILFTVPVYDVKNNIIAVLGGSANLQKQHYLRSLAALKLGHNGFLTMYDTTRTVLMHPDRSRVLQQVSPGTNQLLDKALAGFEGTEETSTLYSMPVLSSVKRLKSTDWVLVVSYPLVDAYAPLYTTRKYLLAGSLAAGLLSLMIVWPLMKYLTRPLLAFTRHLEQMPTMEGGDQLVPIHSNDEIGILVKTFNRMMIELGQQKSALKEQKEFAENLVLNSSVPTFVIDPQHKILIWNKACEELTGVKVADIIGTDRHWSAFCEKKLPSLADVIIDGSYETLSLLDMKCERSDLFSAGWHCEGWYEQVSGLRRYVLLDAAPIYNDKSELIAAIETIRDISELKKAEQDLECSRDFYLTLFENFPALIWRSGTNAKFNYFNQTWLEFTGRTLERELGDGWTEGVHPEDLAFCIATYLDAFHARKPFEMEYRLCRHDGEYRWIINMGRPFNGLDGNFAGYIGTCYDVTDREEAANKIRKLSHAIEQSPNSIVIATLDGTIEYANPRTIETSGYSVEELVGQNLKLLYPSEGAYEVELAMRKMLTQGNEWRGELPGWGKGGKNFWEHLTLSPIKNQDGRITHIVGIREDITQRKQAAKALNESEERYRQLFESNPHPMWAHDLETLAFLAVNEAAVRRYGYSREEFSVMTIKDIWSPEEIPALIGNDANVTKGIDESGVWHHRTKGGAIILVEITSHTLNFAGREATIVLANDVTEKKRSEEEKIALEHQLRQSQKMEAVGTLAGGIAHDFNNLLTGIIGYSDLMQMEMEKNNPMQQMVSQILLASQRAVDLTSSLLAYSSKQISNPYSVGLNFVIINIEKLLRRLIPENIGFKTMLTEEDLTIMADPVQVEQVLMNLVTNARDAMPDGGVLRTTTEPVMLDRDFIEAHGYGTAGPYALLTVADTGKGMDKKTMDRIFEPFFTTKEVGKGTGLGLSIVYGIVKQHNGFIKCYSEPGHGTVFRIYLPLIDEPAHNVINVTDNDLAGGNETILLVDDDIGVRDMIQELLERYGYTVIKAIDGEDAVQKFKVFHNDVDLVILDVIMPKMNGKEVYNMISAISPSVRVLFISGYTADIINGNFVVDDRCSFVSKPISANKLLSKVREVLVRNCQ